MCGPHSVLDDFALSLPKTHVGSSVEEHDSQSATPFAFFICNPPRRILNALDTCSALLYLHRWPPKRYTCLDLLLISVLTPKP